MSTLRRGKQPLLITNPDLAKEWDYEKNAPLTPNDVTAGMGTKVWWKCAKDHSWQTYIYTRSSGVGCPICSGKKVLVGYNDLATTNPNLVEQWDFEKNGVLTPFSIVAGSNKKVWWRDECGHNWSATVYSRTQGVGCPFCSGNRVLVGFNDLQTLAPEVAKEWNYVKNKPLLPTDYVSKSGKKVWWICNRGHEWQASIDHRVSRMDKCPICSNKLLLVGYNDLQTTQPLLSREWNYEKNEGLTPQRVGAGTPKRVWWICEQGHEWQAAINSRVAGNGCPFCSRRYIAKGETDLATTNPLLAREWNYEKNYPLIPQDVMAGSRQKVWWICEQGHEWQAALYTRLSGVNCPYCAKELRTSFPEQALFYYLKKEYEDAVNTDFDAVGVELDIYIPSKRIAVEYDGTVWHNNAVRFQVDSNKNLLCAARGITLIRVREPGLENLDGCICIFRGHSSSDDSLNKAIQEVFLHIDNSIKTDININRDRSDIYNSFVSYRKANSLLTKYPEIANEWHPTKNGKVEPDMITCHSGKKVWWLGKCGHEWQAVVSSRISGSNCPFCAGQKVLAGFNDLATINPELASEWHPSKNGILKPDMVTAHSSKTKVWWVGQCGHEWQARVSDRNNGNRGCPYCASQKVLAGFNDLATINPELASEWHPSKNGTLKPNMVTAHSSNIKVWWLCSQGHSYNSTISNRSEGNGCPYCSNKAVLAGYNDLATVNPSLANEWHPTKNGELSPNMIVAGSDQRVWWICDKGHEWKARLADRNKGKGCPYCAGQKVIPGVNDLLTLNPALASEWNNEKNGELKPSMIMPNHNKKVWWKCSKGHEWEARVNSRNRGNGCPYCSGLYVIAGVNDLATKFPQIAAEWHPTKNGIITPKNVTKGSNKIVWWRCNEGHEWQSVIHSRTGKHGAGCPICNNKRKAERTIKPVKNTDTGKVYQSVKDAAKSVGLSSGSIVNACKGKTKTAGGYHWKYIDQH